MVDTTEFNVVPNNEEEDFIVDFGEVINVGGGGGTDDFNTLKNRPKYNNQTMTGSTNIPKVPTKTSELQNDSDYQTGTQVSDAINTAVAGKQDVLTAGDNITIEDNTISATDTTYTAGTGIDITSNVISITGQEVRILSSDDYDYPTNNPTAVALWKLNEGLYFRPSGVNAQPTNSDTVSGGEGCFIIVGKQSGGTIARITILGRSFSTASDNKYQGVEQYAVRISDGHKNTYTTGLNTSSIVDNLTSTSTVEPLSANQGKVLKDLIDGLLISGAGAPTTATVGTVGMLYEDTTNGKLYQCTAVSGSTYTWTEVGAGGGGPTVVQTTGTSQTDVMSQNATTSMVYADPATKYKIHLGVTGAVTGNAATGIGYNTLVTGDNAIAIGNNATSSVKGGVALGVGANPTSVGEVNIGSDTYTAFGYNNSSYRLLTGLYDPQNAHDAATKGYVDSIVVNYATLTAAGAPTTSTAAVSVGQLYYDSTNDDYYYCSAIDTTDPQNPSYTWSALSTGGGGGPTVVQTTGTSTTDVMSQNAVTSMICNDPSNMIQIRFGKNAQASTTYESVGIGYNGKGTAYGAIGIMGDASGNRAVAIGVSASASARGAVAFPGSTANIQGMFAINVGDASIGYNNSNNRLVRGVYDGQNSNDAVNVGQVNATIDAINTALSTNIPHIGA